MPETNEQHCVHMNFNAFAEVGRINKEEGGPIVAYMCDLKINCRDCGQVMEFVGLPCGLSFYRPAVSIDCATVHLPMVIPGETIPEGMAGYGVQFTPFEEKLTKQ